MIVLPRLRRVGFVLPFGLLLIASIVMADRPNAPLSIVPSVPAETLRAQESASGAPASQSSPLTVKSRGAEIVLDGGYPELRVDGEPFFVHSAAFFYYRVPADLWEVSLERYRSLGINTIDLYIPWNWHELKEGEFDFDGHSNPRRDLRRLLKFIAGKNLKLIARPGPLILNEWRHGGYPDWLLEKADVQSAWSAEYRMSPREWIDGGYPPLAELSSRDADAAARAWLANPAFMDYARKWMAAVGHELAPFGARQTEKLAASAAATSPGDKNAAPAPDRTGASDSSNLPLLFVQLDENFAMGDAGGSSMCRYLESLRETLRGAGVVAPVFVNSTDARVAAASASLSDSIGVMGHWFMRPGAVNETKERALAAEDSSTIEFLTEELSMQAKFPPGLIEYQAGWFAPADDDRPEESAAENTLDSSRLFLAHGLHAISYFPLQDSVTPAGWSAPGANPDYLWNAALDANGHSRRLADAVARNGEIIMRWGAQLAATHKRADFGIALAMSGDAKNWLSDAEFHRVSEGVQKIERLAQLDHLSSELLDPENQPVDRLLRDRLLLLPVFERAADATGRSDRTPMQLSEKSQRALVEYVRRGGTLVVFPKRPAGDLIAELWKGAPESGAEPSQFVSGDWHFGEGRVIESSEGFFLMDRSPAKLQPEPRTGEFGLGDAGAARDGDSCRSASGSDCGEQSRGSEQPDSD